MDISIENKIEIFIWLVVRKAAFYCHLKQLKSQNKYTIKK